MSAASRQQDFGGAAIFVGERHDLLRRRRLARVETLPVDSHPNSLSDGEKDVDDGIFALEVAVQGSSRFSGPLSEAEGAAGRCLEASANRQVTSRELSRPGSPRRRG